MESYPKKSHKYSNKEYNKKRNEKHVHASKYLALVLRHKAVDFGLTVEPNGFIKLEDIFALQQSKKYHFTVDMVKEIIATDEKGRYELVDRPPLYIRAVQGHSLAQVTNDETLTKIENIFKYPTVVHGTDKNAWGFIEKTGLNKMARNAIHFSIGYVGEGHVKSGMRKNCEIFIEVNAIYAYYNNIPFYISTNNVVLSPGIDGVIPTEYLKLVTNKDHNILYSQQYVGSVHYTTNKIKIFEKNKEIKELDNSISDNEISVLNAVSDLLISLELVKKPFITVVDKGLESKYCQIIQEGIEGNKIQKPGVFVDYIVLPQGKNICEAIDNHELDSKFMKKVTLNWDIYYSSNK